MIDWPRFPRGCRRRKLKGRGASCMADKALAMHGGSALGFGSPLASLGGEAPPNPPAVGGYASLRDGCGAHIPTVV
jgi:hypothetical protein